MREREREHPRTRAPEHPSAHPSTRAPERAPERTPCSPAPCRLAAGSEWGSNIERDLAAKRQIAALRAMSADAAESEEEELNLC